MSDFEWFCDEVEEVALRLGLHLTPTEGVNHETRGRWSLNNEENFTIATTDISNQSENEEKSEEKNEEKNSMAFEVQITPKQKSKVATKSPGIDFDKILKKFWKIKKGPFPGRVKFVASL